MILFLLLSSMQNNNVLHNIDNQHDILDISSGFLHLVGNSLVPESLHRNCLEDAKVLQQVDKKFIPIVAGGMLAVIDQVSCGCRFSPLTTSYFSSLLFLMYLGVRED